MFIAYAIIEDRTESILSYEGNEIRSKGFVSVTRKLNKIKTIAERKGSLSERYFSDNLIDEILEWKDARNRLMHALMKQSLTTEDLEMVAFRDNYFGRIKLPDTVEIIENNAFLGAIFEFIKLSANLKILMPGAFDRHWFSFVDLPETLETIKSSAICALVAVVRGNPKLSYNQMQVLYANDSVDSSQIYLKERHSLSEVDQKYNEYKNCGIVVRSDDGKIIQL